MEKIINIVPTFSENDFWRIVKLFPETFLRMTKTDKFAKLVTLTYQPSPMHGVLHTIGVLEESSATF